MRGLVEILGGEPDVAAPCCWWTVGLFRDTARPVFL